MPAGFLGEKVGRYELLAQLTAGGMSQLFLGATTGPGGFRKYVVIKRILPDSASDENFVSMFLDEARITASFSHPNIAHVFELGEDHGGFYVAMEFISGANLNDVFDACALKQRVLPLGFSASALHDCALALHYAHTFRTAAGDDAGVIHRDVAQKNIMVTYDGQVKLLDFGVAKARNALASTKAGTVKGTAGYMSPEQVRGGPLDGRSDVFSLGIVLWEMTTGRRLFSANTEVEEMRLILSGPIQSSRECAEWIPEPLEAVTMRALARDRDDRYPNAKEFARALSSECGDLLFDVDARSAFMRELFTERVEATRSLFEAADQPKRPELLREALQGLEDLGLAVAADAPPRKRRKGLVDPGAANDEAIDRALKVDRQARRRKRAVTQLVFAGALTVTGALAVAVAAKHFATRPPAAALPAPVPEPTLADSEPALPGVPRLQAFEKNDDSVDPAPAPAPKQNTKRSGSGDVTLALFPEASVFRGTEKLGAGHLVSFALPAGTHRLTVVGADGVRRVLPLTVQSGKNKPQRFRLEDLPSK